MPTDDPRHIDRERERFVLRQAEHIVDRTLSASDVANRFARRLCELAGESATTQETPDAP